MDGWVGWRAYRYQIIQELETPVGKESFGVLFLHFGLGVLVICPYSPLSCLFVPCLASLAGFAIFDISGLFSGKL